MEQAGMLTGESLLVVDKRDRQAVLQAILELEDALSPVDCSSLRLRRKPLMQAVLGLEKEYARLDTLLEEAADRINDAVSSLRRMLADRRMLQAKDRLYAEVLPFNEMNRLMSEARFNRWRSEFQAE